MGVLDQIASKGFRLAVNGGMGRTAYGSFHVPKLKI